MKKCYKPKYSGKLSYEFWGEINSLGERHESKKEFAKWNRLYGLGVKLQNLEEKVLAEMKEKIKSEKAKPIKKNDITGIISSAYSAMGVVTKRQPVFYMKMAKLIMQKLRRRYGVSCEYFINVIPSPSNESSTRITCSVCIIRDGKYACEGDFTCDRLAVTA